MKILKPKSYKISAYSIRDIHREYFKDISINGVLMCGLASNGLPYYWDELDQEWYLLSPVDKSLMDQS